MHIQVSIQILRFEGAKYILGGQDFCFYYMFQTNVFEHSKIWGCTKTLGDTAPNATPVAMCLCIHGKQFLLPKLLFACNVAFEIWDIRKADSDLCHEKPQ